MRYLALILQLPLFAILSWIYLSVVRRNSHADGQRYFHYAVLVLAWCLSIAAMLFAYDSNYEHAGPIWKQIAAALAAFHIFPLVLFVGWYLRRRS